MENGAFSKCARSFYHFSLLAVRYFVSKNNRERSKILLAGALRHRLCLIGQSKASCWWPVHLKQQQQWKIRCCYREKEVTRAIFRHVNVSLVALMDVILLSSPATHPYASIDHTPMALGGQDGYRIVASLAGRSWQRDPYAVPLEVSSPPLAHHP